MSPVSTPQRLRLAVKASPGSRTRPWADDDEDPEAGDETTGDDQDLDEEPELDLFDDQGDETQPVEEPSATDPTLEQAGQEPSEVPPLFPDEAPPAAQQDTGAEEIAPAAPPERDPEAPQWAGDLYEEGDETSPEQAFGSFTGQDGETAWLDKDERDGTLIGWLRTADGAVYRYVDADAWAQDVDDAGMTMASGPTAPPEAGDEGAPAEQAAEGEDELLPPEPEGKSLAYRLVLTGR